MATSRSRYSRDDDEDDDDRPRRKRRDEDDDDDDDDRPRSRRKREDDDDDDDRPARKKRRDDDDDDDDDRPARKKKRRKAGGVGAGKIIAIIGGIAGIVGAIVLVVMLATGSLGGANISYEKYKGIRGGATLDSLEKSFGKAKKLDKAEAAKIQYAKGFEDMGGGGFGGGGFGGGGRGGAGATLADLEPFGITVDAWYHWHSGSEDIYVMVGKDQFGKSGPLMKVYTNSNATKENARAGGDMTKMVPGFQVSSIN